MDNNRLRLPILFSFICMFAIGTAQAGEEAEIVVEKIDVAAAKDYVAGHDDAVILDVRTPAE
jgi:hypothetical protein